VGGGGCFVKCFLFKNLLKKFIFIFKNLFLKLVHKNIKKYYFQKYKKIKIFKILLKYKNKNTTYR
jgi:hypothetical protein